MQHDTGTILYRSWGYDQTNIDFYQVTKKIGKTMNEVRAIASRAKSDVGGPSVTVVPHINKFTGDPMKRRPDKNGYVKVCHYDHAYPWDGRPKHETGFGWGH